MGLTGVIIEATFKLIPITSSYIKVDTKRFKNLDDLMQEMIEADKKYSLRAQLPSQSTDIKEITEYIILLATKKDFVLVDEEDEANFHKRLDELGRGNWRKRPLAYSIYKE